MAEDNPGNNPGDNDGDNDGIAGGGSHGLGHDDHGAGHEAAAGSSDDARWGAADAVLDDIEALVALDPVSGAEHAAITAQLSTERDEYLDALRRLQADFENYRKRVQRDSDAAADRAGERLVTRILPVLDTFEMALSHEADPDASPLAKLHDSLLTALEGEGLARVHPAGEPFDPAVAEAVAHEEGEGGPVVSDVLRAGYLWKGRVVRAAMVKVRG